MNIPLILKHFPQLQPLPPQQQAAILQAAHDRAYSPDKKLQHWRRNVISLAWVTAIGLFISLVAGPAFNMSRPMTGGIIMVVLLPGFMYARHRQYIAQLRPEVEKLMAERE